MMLKTNKYFDRKLLTDCATPITEILKAPYHIFKMPSTPNYFHACNFKEKKRFKIIKSNLKWCVVKFFFNRCTNKEYLKNKT